MDKTAGRLLLYFLLLALLVFSGLFYDSFQLVKSLAFLAAASAILVYASIYGVKIPLTLPAAAAAAFYVYMLVSAAVSPHKPPAYYVFTLLAPAGFFAALFLENHKKHLLIFINAACAAASLYFFYQLLANPSARPYSFFGNPIFFAEFIAMNFPLLTASLFLFREKKWLITANVLLCFFALLLSGSRGAFISFLVSMIFLAVYLLRFNPVKLPVLLKRSLSFIVPAALVFLVLLLNPAASRAVKNSFSRGLAVFSLENRAVVDRVLIMKSGLKMAEKSFGFGRGAGAFRQLYQQYQSGFIKEGSIFTFLTTSYAHNDFIQLLSEFGAAGLALYLLFFFSLLYRFDRSSHLFEGGAYVLNLGLLCSLLCFFIEGCFNFPLFIMPAAGLFWVYAGLLHGGPVPGEKTAPPAFSRAFCAAMTATALLALGLNLKPVLSNFCLKQGVNEMTRQSNLEMDYFSRAMELDPAGYYAYFYSGMSYSKKRDFEKAAEFYKKALSVYPASADALYNVAACLNQSEKPEEAVVYYKKALELYPGFQLARLNLGKTYLGLGMEKEGIAEIAAAKKSGTYDPESLNEVVTFVEATWLEGGKNNY